MIANQKRDQQRFDRRPKALSLRERIKDRPRRKGTYRSSTTSRYAAEMLVTDNWSENPPISEAEVHIVDKLLASIFLQIEAPQ